MNLLEEEKQIKKVDRKKWILPFYRQSDLDSVSQEISIDKFEEYANYRMGCMLTINVD